MDFKRPDFKTVIENMEYIECRENSIFWSEIGHELFVNEELGKTPPPKFLNVTLSPRTLETKTKNANCPTAL